MMRPNKSLNATSHFVRGALAQAVRQQVIARGAVLAMSFIVEPCVPGSVPTRIDLETRRELGEAMIEGWQGYMDTTDMPSKWTLSVFEGFA